MHMHSIGKLVHDAFLAWLEGRVHAVVILVIVIGFDLVREVIRP